MDRAPRGAQRGGEVVVIRSHAGYLLWVAHSPKDAARWIRRHGLLGKAQVWDCQLAVQKGGITAFRLVPL